MTEYICSANSFIRVTLEALAQNILDIKCVEKVNTDHAHGCETVLIYNFYTHALY